MKLKLERTSSAMITVGIAVAAFAGSQIGTAISHPLLMPIYTVGLIILANAPVYQMRRKITELELKIEELQNDKNAQPGHVRVQENRGKIN